MAREKTPGDRKLPESVSRLGWRVPPDISEALHGFALPQGTGQVGARHG